MAQTPIELRDVEGDGGDVCRVILDLLPSWFGLPEAIDAFVQTADSHPSVIASINRDDVGITIIKHHSPYAAEVYLMAVKPSVHRVVAVTVVAGQSGRARTRPPGVPLRRG